MLFTGLLFMACSVCFLIESMTTSQGMAPSTVGWGLPHQSLIKTMSYRFAYSLGISSVEALSSPVTPLTSQQTLLPTHSGNSYPWVSHRMRKRQMQYPRPTILALNSCFSLCYFWKLCRIAGPCLHSGVYTPAAVNPVFGAAFSLIPDASQTPQGSQSHKRTFPMLLSSGCRAILKQSSSPAAVHQCQTLSIVEIGLCKWAGAIRPGCQNLI